MSIPESKPKSSKGKSARSKVGMGVVAKNGKNSPVDVQATVKEWGDVVENLPESVAEVERTHRLTFDQKYFIVTCLAEFMTNTEINEQLRDVFGIQVSRQLLNYYNPLTANGSKMNSEWKALFQQKRSEFLQRMNNIGVSQLPVRLRRIERAYERAIQRGNDKFALDCLRQAAEECGGKYTNTQNMNVKTDERAALASLLGVSIESLPERPGDDLRLPMPNKKKVGAH